MVAFSKPTPKRYTPEEYLERERNAAFKSEYLDGQIYAMAGSSPDHAAITVNLTAAIRAALRGGPCRAFSNDMKVCTTPTGLYAYPDLTVLCGQPVFHSSTREVLTNPSVLFEILSPSTQNYDRGEKFVHYQQIESLTDYILIAQDKPRIDHFERQPGGKWLLSNVIGLESLLTIPSLNCTFPLSEIYDQIEFQNDGALAGESTEETDAS